VEAVELSTAKGTLLEDFGHDTLSSSSAKASWKYSDFDQPGQPSGQATATVNMVATTVASLAITAPGSGGTAGTYALAFSGGGGGTGATGTYTISGGAVTAVTLTANGSGYMTAPSVLFPTGDIVGASAVATLTGRAVSSLTLTYGGYGYGSAPTVSILGGGGSGAAFTSTISGGVVTSFTKTSGGSGYTTTPKASIATSSGNVTLVTGSITCTDTINIVLTPDDASLNWAANSWDQTSAGKKGVVMLASTVITGVGTSVTRRVVANSALSPGGTCSLALDLPLDATTYDSCSLHGTSVGGSVVWRRYKPADALIAAAITNQSFTYPFPYHTADGMAAAMTTERTSAILYSATGVAPFQQAPCGYDVDPSSGSLMFYRPTVSLYCPMATMIAGGTPCAAYVPDVRVLVPVYKSNLKATYPADVAGVATYSGNLHSVEGIDRTLFITVNEWRDPVNQANMDRFASEMFDSVSNTIVDGSFVLDDVAFDVLTPGVAANLNGNAYTIGWESASSFPALPITGTELIWQSTGGGVQYSQSIQCSNRRAAYSAAPFLMPDRVGVHIGFQDGSGGSAVMGGVSGGMMQGAPMSAPSGGGGGGGGMDPGAMGMDDFGGDVPQRRRNSAGRRSPGQRLTPNQRRDQREAVQEMGRARPAVPVPNATPHKPTTVADIGGYREFGRNGSRHNSGRRQAPPKPFKPGPHVDPSERQVAHSPHAPASTGELVDRASGHSPLSNVAMTPMPQRRNLPKPSTSFRDDFGSVISTDQIASNE
jgi:hypothetical protein